MADGEGGKTTAVQRRIGLVVVHGVGDTEPGYCVNTLLETLSATVGGYQVSPYYQMQNLTDTAATNGTTQYPAVMRQANRDGIELTGIELHWADLSNHQPGRLNTLLGLFRIIFESHHLVDAMLRRGGEWGAQILRVILLVAGWMLRGPLAALTLATTAIFAVLLYGPATGWFEHISVQEKFLMVQEGLLIGAIVTLVLIVRSRDISWFDSVFWLVIVTLGLAVLENQGVLKGILEKVPDLAYQRYQKVDCGHAETLGACYIEGLYRIIIWGWRAWALLLLIAVAMYLMMALVRRTHEKRAGLASVSTAISIVILQFMFWTITVVSGLFPLLARAESGAQFHKIMKALRDLWTQVHVPEDGHIAKLLQAPNIDLDWIDRFKFVYATTAFTFFLFIAMTGFLMIARRVIAGRSHGTLDETARRLPRLLFNRSLVSLLIVSCVIVIALILVLPLFDKKEIFHILKEWLLPFAALVAVATPFLLGHRLSNIVHIARDLIDHHYCPRIETAAYFFPSIFRTRKARPRRSQIQDRLVTLLDTMVKNKGFDEVIFVAHSQGAVVAYDYLRMNGPAYPELSGARPYMLSFGSPLGHIYQKYFYEYGTAGPAALSSLAGRLARWVNLYRVDDYIGSRVDGSASVAIENRALLSGGHTDYWREGALARALDDLIQGRPDVAASPEADAWTRAMRRG